MVRSPTAPTQMTSADTDDATDLPADLRTAALELSDGVLVVYDPQNHAAWLQSDVPLDLDAYR